MRTIYQPEELADMAKALYRQERQITRLDGWFLAKETEMLKDPLYQDLSPQLRKAH